MSKIHIRGDGQAVITISGRCSNTGDYWDGNWLVTQFEAILNGHTANLRGCFLRTDEIANFLLQIKQLDESLKGKAELKTMEDVVYLCGEMDNLGGLHWSGKTNYSNNNLHFSLRSDQTHLKQLVQELEQVLQKFPVIGQP